VKTGIYKIINTINNRFYIGSTSSELGFKERFRIHKRELLKNKHHSYKLQKDWNTFSKNAFKFEIIEECEPKKCIINEQKYINELSPYYNIAKKAGSQLGYRHRKKDKLKMSKIKGGQPFLVYTLNDEFIGKFDTQSECANKLNIDQSKISLCLNGKRSRHKQFKFRYLNSDFIFYKKERTFTNRPKHSPETRKKIALSQKRREVYCVNNKTWYNSILEASRKLNINENSIRRSLNNIKCRHNFKFIEKE
jgi:hypothetical protein